MKPHFRHTVVRVWTSPRLSLMIPHFRPRGSLDQDQTTKLIPHTFSHEVSPIRTAMQHLDLVTQPSSGQLAIPNWTALQHLDLVISGTSGLAHAHRVS